MFCFEAGGWGARKKKWYRRERRYHTFSLLVGSFLDNAGAEEKLEQRTNQNKHAIKQVGEQG